MKKDPIKVIPLEKVQLNEGQIDWLPRNPRTWTQTDIDRTKRSLDEDPDFMQERPILAVPGPDKNTFVAFCGNLRLTAARALGWPGVPVVVYRPDGISKEDRDTIIRRAIKDNGSFGSWDTDLLANEWNAEPWQLEEWGVPDWITGAAGKDAGGPSPDDFGEDFELPDGEKADARQMSFVLSYVQAELVDAAIGLSLATLGDVNEENENRNGVALFEIVKEWSLATIGEVDEENARADLKKATAKAEEIRQYLCDALQKSGRKSKDVDDILGTNGMAGHYFGASQWLLPTRSAYEKMQTILPLGRKYEDLAEIVARQKYMAALVELRKFIGKK